MLCALTGRLCGSSPHRPSAHPFHFVMRWHGFSDQVFQAYMGRFEKEVYDYMKACEAKERQEFTKVIAHHSFLNPLDWRT